MDRILHIVHLYTRRMIHIPPLAHLSNKCQPVNSNTTHTSHLANLNSSLHMTPQLLHKVCISHLRDRQLQGTQSLVVTRDKHYPVRELHRFRVNTSHISAQVLRMEIYLLLLQVLQVPPLERHKIFIGKVPHTRSKSAGHNIFSS